MILNDKEQKILDQFREAGFQGRVFSSMEALLKHYGITDWQR